MEKRCNCHVEGGWRRNGQRSEMHIFLRFCTLTNSNEQQRKKMTSREETKVNELSVKLWDLWTCNFGCFLRWLEARLRRHRVMVFDMGFFVADVVSMLLVTLVMSSFIHAGVAFLRLIFLNKVDAGKLTQGALHNFSWWSFVLHWCSWEVLSSVFLLHDYFVKKLYLKEVMVL